MSDKPFTNEVPWEVSGDTKTCLRCGFDCWKSEQGFHECVPIEESKYIPDRLDAAERELASLRERHDKALSLLSDVVLQNTRLNERLMRVELWMKAELAKLG